MNAYEQRMEQEWKEYREKRKSELYPNIMLVGMSGAGKSSLINKIFGGYFVQTNNVRPETQGYEIYYGRDYDCSVNLIDTAVYELGQADSCINNIVNVAEREVDGNKIHIICYCIPIVSERIQDIDIQTLQHLMRVSNIKKRLCIVFTKCDEDTPDGAKAKVFKK